MANPQFGKYQLIKKLATGGMAEVFRAELGSGISANPYLQFHLTADRTGHVVVDWIDDRGDTGSVKAVLDVSE